MKKTLKICFPTYNRCGAIVARLNELFSKPLPENVSVLVIDNNSTDDTYQRLSQIAREYQGLRVLQNPTNLGYAGNFFRLFDEADSDYLLIDSDEDEILVDQIPQFLDFLEIHTPSFVSPKATVFDYTYRGAGKNGEIQPKDFRESSNYLSGITFEVSAARKACTKAKQLINKNAAAHVYPQVLVAAEMICCGKALWYSKTLTLKRQQLQSYIKNPDGGAYYHLTGRYQQNIGFIDYLRGMATENSANLKIVEAITDMLDAAEQRIFHDLRAGLSHERPDLLKSFDYAGRQFYGMFGLLRRVSSKFGLALNEPERILPYVKKRLNSVRG